MHQKNQKWKEALAYYRFFWKSTRIRNKLYKKCLEKPNSELYEKYKYYRNKLNRLKKILKNKTYYERIFENIKGDLKQTWKLINDLTKRDKQESVKETEFEVDKTLINDNKNTLSTWVQTLQRKLRCTLMLHLNLISKETMLNPWCFLQHTRRK